MATAASRINFRIPQSTEERLRAAAEASRETLTNFVLSAASHRADEVLATRTLVESDFFDRMILALDEPPVVMAELATAAKRAKRSVQR